MNEIGLDPGCIGPRILSHSLTPASGIDHLYAVKTIDEVHRAGGKITSFLSYCGGLPAPEASGNRPPLALEFTAHFNVDNPFGIKWSWSPRGFLLTAANNAKFWKGGKIQETPGKDVMRNAEEYGIYPAFAFYAFPNRDSSVYKERYNIPEAHTIIRGSLRYKVGAFGFGFGGDGGGNIGNSRRLTWL